MRSCSSHKTIVRLLKIMDGMEDTVCIQPSSVLIGMCQELNISEPIYSQVSKERFKFKFSVHVAAAGCKVTESDGDFLVIGYSFRDKSDAIESAALALVDLLVHKHGIRLILYSDLVFMDNWPAYDHISKNLKTTCSALLDITSEISSLIERIDDHCNVFEVEMLSLNGGAGHSIEGGGSVDLTTILDDCHTELQSTRQVLYSWMNDHFEALYWRCQSHRFYRKGKYNAIYNLHKDLDVKWDSISTLKMTLAKVCDRGGYVLGDQSCRGVSEGFYIAEIVLIKTSGSIELEETFCVNSIRLKSVHECQRDAIFRAINLVCAKEGVKIVDAGYPDLRAMQKERCEFKHEVPLLCNIVSKMKAGVEIGFKNIDVLNQRYYRLLRDPKLCAKLRLGLADCISDFIYITQALNEELKKMEVYSSQPVPHGGDS